MGTGMRMGWRDGRGRILAFWARDTLGDWKRVGEGIWCWCWFSEVLSLSLWLQICWEMATSLGQKSHQGPLKASLESSRAPWVDAVSTMASFTPRFLAGNPLLPTPSPPTHCGSE